MKQDDEDIPEEEQDGFTMGEIQPSSNFSNPVYETMFQQVIIQIATKSDEFSEKCQRGRGVILNPKNYVANFGNFKPGFLRMKLTRKSNFRVQGKFFQQLY